MFADPDFDGEPTRPTEEEIDEDGRGTLPGPASGPAGRRGRGRTPGAADVIDPPPPGRREVLRPRRAGRDRHRGRRTTWTPTGQQAPGAARSPSTSAKGPHARHQTRTTCGGGGPTRRSGRSLLDELDERGIDFHGAGRRGRAARRRPVRPALPPGVQCPPAHPPGAGRAGSAGRRPTSSTVRPGGPGRAARRSWTSTPSTASGSSALPDVLKVPPLSAHGTPARSPGGSAGPAGLRAAVDQLQEYLYAA